MHKQILDDFQNNAILLFYHLTYIHTCKLEFDIFLLRWDMIDQKIFPNGYPYKFYTSPPTIASILFFDVIADKAHSVHFIFVTSLLRWRWSNHVKPYNAH